MYMYAYYISPGQKGRFSHNTISYMVLVDASYLNTYVPTINTMHNEQCIVLVESRSNFFESYFVFPVSVVLQNFPVPTGNGLLQILKKTVIKIDKKEALVMDLVLL